MRRTVLFGLLLLLSCGDPGLRDRSLMASLDKDRGAFNPYAIKKKAGPTSVIGLAPDQLAHYYPDNPELVVRFRDLGSIGREASAQLDKIRAALPEVVLPDGDAVTILRRVLKLPPGVIIDPVRPFAFVKVRHGWAAILPTRSQDKAVARLKQLDAVYCVCGDPGVVATYRPGFRKGFYLPGDLSVIADAGSLRTIGKEVTQALEPIGMDLSAIDRFLPPIPNDIERVDLAFRLHKGSLRIDVRAAPARDSPTAVYLERLRPASSGAVRWLPSKGTAYVEFTSPPLDWEGLVSVLCRDFLVASSSREQLMFSVRRLLGALGKDAACVLNLPPDRAGSLMLVAQLEDPKVAQAFFDSVDHAELLEVVAGPGGDLRWRPNAFDHAGYAVGSVHGNLSRERLLEWRRSGDVFLATLGSLLRGPAVVYVATVEDKLCLVIGQKARSDIEALIEHVSRGRAVDNDHNVEVVGLFPQRLAAASFDLAGLFNGLRHAAPHWHENGRELRNTTIRWKMPASIAITSEGGALRAAVRLQPPMLAEAAARIRERLR